MRKTFSVIVLCAALLLSILSDLGLLPLFGIPRWPPCPPCLDRPDLAQPDLRSQPPDLAPPPDMQACSGVAGPCNAPGVLCCPGLTCVGGACADVAARCAGAAPR